MSSVKVWSKFVQKVRWALNFQPISKILNYFCNAFVITALFLVLSNVRAWVVRRSGDPFCPFHSPNLKVKQTPLQTRERVCIYRFILCPCYLLRNEQLNWIFMLRKLKKLWTHEMKKKKKRPGLIFFSFSCSFLNSLSLLRWQRFLIYWNLRLHHRINNHILLHKVLFIFWFWIYYKFAWMKM